MMNLFYKTCEACSKITTENYSTSFASAIKLLHKDIRADIHNIYGFVRFADEIVDTFHDFDKEELLQSFCEETYKAIDKQISLNPILHSFQYTVNKYKIDIGLIDAFFNSMQYDLNKKHFMMKTLYKEYIYGSAEVVGLMCLYIFCEGETGRLFDELKDVRKKLGSCVSKSKFFA